VIMCHGSNYKHRVVVSTIHRVLFQLTKISEETTYNPSVAKSESTIFLKMWLVKRAVRLIECEETRFSMPLIASKNAANYRKDAL
jgi:hypothetical protein